MKQLKLAFVVGSPMVEDTMSLAAEVSIVLAKISCQGQGCSRKNLQKQVKDVVS